MTTETETDTTSIELQPLSRLVAHLSHFDNVSVVEPRPDSDERALVRVVNNGIGVREINAIRRFGYVISAVSMRHNYVTVRPRQPDTE